MEDEADILIIGAGVAGLAAAQKLSSAEFKVVVLEARDRIGGRINTHFNKRLRVPIELGAEFVHGKPKETLEIVERGRIALAEVPNRHWYFRHGILAKSAEYWSKTEDMMDKMKCYTGPDQSFREFLDGYKQKHQLGESEAMVTLYVEGFHAARTELISVNGLNKTNEAAAGIEDDKQFRTLKGYNLIAQTLHDEAVAHGATFRLNTVVEEVQWKPNRVEVTTRSQNRASQFKSSRALITLPLALLQANETELVRFLPQLRNKQEAARKLSMGQVAKIILQFRQPFWEDVRLPTKNGSSDDLKELAFIHAPDEMVPTWWTQLPLRVPLLVGWAGGPRAEALSLEGEQYLLDQSLRALSRILGISRRSIEALLEASYTHNWGTDPFSCGAYSYLPVGGLKAQGQLAQSVENTLFFAGEATNTEGHHATVHGAIASGSRAAKEIIGGTLAT